MVSSNATSRLELTLSLGVSRLGRVGGLEKSLVLERLKEHDKNACNAEGNSMSPFVQKFDNTVSLTLVVRCFDQLSFTSTHRPRVWSYVQKLQTAMLLPRRLLASWLPRWGRTSPIGSICVFTTPRAIAAKTMRLSPTTALPTSTTARLDAGRHTRFTAGWVNRCACDTGRRTGTSAVRPGCCRWFG